MTQDNIRLFTALPVSDRLREQVADLPVKGLDNARWLHTADLHITLRFLGDVPAVRLPEIKETLARVRRPPFHIEIDGLDAFHNKNQTVLYARVASTRKLTALTAEVNDKLAALGFEPPNPARKFTPHVTLARLKKPKGIDGYIAWHGRAVKDCWETDRYALYRSVSPDDKGRRYPVLSRYELR